MVKKIKHPEDNYYDIPASIIDPTKNVKDLFDAGMQRQDDLRRIEGTWRDKTDNIRSYYTLQLSEAESKRIDAIRGVDVQAVATAATAAETRANTLAQQVQVSAETLRITLDSKVSPILEAIAALQRAQYETAGGKAQVVDSREIGGNRGLWISVVVAAFAFISSTFISTLAIGVSIYIATRPR